VSSTIAETIAQLAEGISKSTNGHNNESPDQVSESVYSRRLRLESKLDSLLKVAAGYKLAKAIFGKKLPSPSKHSSPLKAIEYAKVLATSKNPKETMIAVVGLLNICAHALSSIPELRDLGYSITKVVQSERLETFFDTE
jgi:hypothetical protein